MFTDEQKKAYASIKAPDELFDKIVSSAENDSKVVHLFKTRFSKIVAAAACVVFVAVASFVSFNGGNVQTSVNDEKLNENSSVAVSVADNEIALAREASYGEASISIELTKDALISVDSGSFDVVGEGKNLTEFSADESVEIIWRTDGGKKSTMTVDYGRKTCELVLEYNGEWVITRK